MHRLKLKWLLPILAVVLVVAVSLMVFLPPKMTVHGQGTLAITNTMVQEPLQLDIVSISDIPAYGVIEPSGCGEFKGRVKIRIDCFLKPESPYYPQYGGAYIVDITSLEYLAGYPGKTQTIPIAELDSYTEQGIPILEVSKNNFKIPADLEDYYKWLDGLPTVWQNNPFHSHFVYYDSTVTDEEIKAEIADVTEYFYAFHTYCWDNDYTFLSQWILVPKQVGTIRDVFIAGDSSPPNKDACELKADDIVSRTDDFDTRTFEESPSTPTDLNIGEKGTIDVGSLPENHSYSYYFSTYTHVNKTNPANADGVLDTFEFYIAIRSGANDSYVGTFTASGDVFTVRDSESVGDILGTGYRGPFTGLTVNVLTGDFIGCHAKSGSITVDRDISGGAGHWYFNGDCIDPTDSETFSALDADGLFSLYGTGTEAGGDPDISNAPSTWAIGTVATSTDYWSSGSEPSWPLDDGECHFTVTNNGDTCSMTVKGTNFTGGVGWTLAGSPGENTVTMKAGKSGDANEGAFITLTTSEQSFISGLAGSGTKKWELLIESPTSHTDGVAKESVVTLTATLD